MSILRISAKSSQATNQLEDPSDDPSNQQFHPPTTRSKLRDLYGFLTKKQQKNNISFPPKKIWDLNLCLIPRLIKVQKPHLMKPNLILLLLFDPLTKPPNTKKKVWAVPTGAGAGFTSPSMWETSSKTSLWPVTIPDFRSKNHPCRLEEEILLKGWKN